jgi:cytochrome c553
MEVAYLSRVAPVVSQLPNPSQPEEVIPFPKSHPVSLPTNPDAAAAKGPLCSLAVTRPGLREICTACARCHSETGQLVAGQTSVIPNSDAHASQIANLRHPLSLEMECLDWKTSASPSRSSKPRVAI